MCLTSDKPCMVEVSLDGTTYIDSDNMQIILYDLKDQAQFQDNVWPNISCYLQEPINELNEMMPTHIVSVDNPLNLVT